VVVAPHAAGDVNALRALLAHGELLRNLVRRDLVERYQRSPLGIVLSLAVPALATVVLTLFFRGLMPGHGREEYALRVFVGYVAFDYFTRALSIAAQTLRGHAALIGKVAFPLELLPLSACVSVLIQLALGLLLFVVANALVGTGVHAVVVWLPLLALLLAVLTAGLALLCATAGVLLRDFAHLLPVALTLLFYVTPIFYSPAIVTDELARELLWWNPLAHAIDGMRRVGVDGTAPQLAGTAYLAACALAAAAAGYATFDRLRHTVVEELG
jgi:lipopolysaccharide transport system permease protein